MASPLDDNDEITGINVTPLVDIVLVLLIIFMATAHLISHRAMNVNLPKAVHTDSAQPAPAQVFLDADGQIKLNNQRMTRAELLVHLQQLRTIDADVRVMLSADERASWAQVTGALDTIRGAGITKIATEVEGVHR